MAKKPAGKKPSGGARQGAQGAASTAKAAKVSGKPGGAPGLKRTPKSGSGLAGDRAPKPQGPGLKRTSNKPGMDLQKIRDSRLPKNNPPGLPSRVSGKPGGVKYESQKQLAIRKEIEAAKPNPRLDKEIAALRRTADRQNNFLPKNYRAPR